MEIGLIGLGVMGAGMVGRLLPKHLVVVFDANADATQDVAATGAVAAELESQSKVGVEFAKVVEIWCHGAMARSAILDQTNEVLMQNPDLGALAPYVADVEPRRWTREDAIDQIAQRGYDRDQFA
jgi:6-phosphogluconate dehydrogenase (decarboxylating)